mmetsp:Transcript_61007/g.196541  ORF Transcript_61007/g.196541 Transcript_61007/m.196541 type:complete len:206 (-) Transcript_61007:2091-2708(-)
MIFATPQPFLGAVLNLCVASFTWCCRKLASASVSRPFSFMWPTRSSCTCSNFRASMWLLPSSTASGGSRPSSSAALEHCSEDSRATCLCTCASNSSSAAKYLGTSDWARACASWKERATYTCCNTAASSENSFRSPGTQQSGFRCTAAAIHRTKWLGLDSMTSRMITSQSLRQSQELSIASSVERRRILATFWFRGMMPSSIASQ